MWIHNLCYLRQWEAAVNGQWNRKRIELMFDCWRDLYPEISNCSLCTSSICWFVSPMLIWRKHVCWSTAVCQPVSCWFTSGDIYIYICIYNYIYMYNYGYMGVSWNGVPQNGWFVVENPTMMDDFGGSPILRNLQIYPTCSAGQRHFFYFQHCFLNHSQVEEHLSLRAKSQRPGHGGLMGKCTRYGEWASEIQLKPVEGCGLSHYL